MYFHYSSQCEAKCAFLALRIYCWRLRTKIVSLIIRNPTTPLTLKPWSSSHHHLALKSRTFATTDQQWIQFIFEVSFEFLFEIFIFWSCLKKFNILPTTCSASAKVCVNFFKLNWIFLVHIDAKVSQKEQFIWIQMRLQKDFGPIFQSQSRTYASTVSATAVFLLCLSNNIPL